MRHLSYLKRLAVFTATAALLAGCGGGGASGSGSGTVGGTTSPADDQIVAAYDYNNDGQIDLLTLQSSASPMTVLGAIEGRAGGDFVDVSAQLAGRAIDANISDAIANYLANSVEIGTGTDLEVVDTNGREITVTVFE